MCAVGRFLRVQQMVFLESFAFGLRERSRFRRILWLPVFDFFRSCASFASRPQIVNPILPPRLYCPSNLCCHWNAQIGPERPGKKNSRTIGLRSIVGWNPLRNGYKKDATFCYEPVALDVACQTRNFN